MNEEIRIGVYICHCGTNIAGTIDVKDVASYARTLKDVVVAKDYVFMCSLPGQEIIRRDIADLNLNRVVVAACSPLLHGPTFRSVVKEAGLNPCLLEMANIREQCSWVHVDKDKATEKAKDLVRMAVAKARLLRPLEDIVLEVLPSAMILGGGIAGMRCAIDLAERGIEVYLVEKGPTLGGMTARIGRLPHTNERGIDVVRALIRSVASNPRIHVFTSSELVDLSGSVGNFNAEIKIKPRYVDENCTLCGECAKVCPIEVPNEYECNLTMRKAIYLPYKGCYPECYVIDPTICTRCGECSKVCAQGAINFDQVEVKKRVKVGAIVLATGCDEYRPVNGEYGYGESKAIVTLSQLRKMLDPEGPTNGALLIDGFTPKRMAFILCVGSLGTTDRSYSYCSQVCCRSALTAILEAKERYPDLDVYVLYRDIRTYGMDEMLYVEAIDKLVKFIRFKDPPKVDPRKMVVEVYDTTIQEKLTIPVDMVVLATGLAPSKELDKICRMLRIGRSSDGFIKEAHLKLRPSESTVDGVFIAGTVSGPKNVAESIVSGSAAAAKVTSLIAKKRVNIEPLYASVNGRKCARCGLCADICPYGALIIEKGRYKVVESLCKGCGVCVASCPQRAITIHQFSDEMLIQQIKAAIS